MILLDIEEIYHFLSWPYQSQDGPSLSKSSKRKHVSDTFKTNLTAASKGLKSEELG